MFTTFLQFYGTANFAGRCPKARFLLNDNAMNISKDKVASINYTLTDDTGKVLDSSDGREPLTYIHGAGNLIAGMEEGLEGKSKGDKLTLHITPEKGYGI